MSDAGIDVLVPVYNAAATLDSAFASIAAQSAADFRVIAIDDGSSDASPDILRRWSAADPRFTVVTQANGGIVDALNAGLRRATAPLIARMDADDISLPTRFAVQRAYLETHADCVGVGCSVAHIDELDNLIHGLPLPGPAETSDPHRVPAREPYIIHPFLMARREAMMAVGAYRSVPHSEDSDLYWRLSEIGRLHNLPDTLGQYRMHQSSISGGSLVNGRIMAVGSRLGALAAAKRRRGDADIAFPDRLIDDLRRAASLEAMMRTVAPLVGPADMPLFGLGVAIKLLELATYRPYEIDIDDCRFIRSTLGARHRLTDENQREVASYLSDAGSRLLRAWQVAETIALLPLRSYPKTIAKRLLRRG